jgi:hypothetical protein
MDWNTHLLFAHVLLLVFWLGTDIGVFVLGKFAQNPKYSVDQRLLLLKPLLILDMFPRVCMVLIVPTGYQLALDLEAFHAPPYLSMGIWLFSGIWLAAVLSRMVWSEQPAGRIAQTVERIIHYFLVPAAGWVGLASIYYGAPIQDSWIAEKVVVFVLIILCVRLLEIAFNPAAVAFMQLANEGSSTELEKQLKSGMNLTYVWVIAIYILVAHSAWLGVSHPGS